MRPRVVRLLFGLVLFVIGIVLWVVFSGGGVTFASFISFCVSLLFLGSGLTYITWSLVDFIGNSDFVKWLHNPDER